MSIMQSLAIYLSIIAALICFGIFIALAVRGNVDGTNDIKIAMSLFLAWLVFSGGCLLAVLLLGV
ncbi:MAG: hypothetical protein N4J56_007139 [Chroococcidiopsis sp. SAG 2025]|uniref:hypothetical protein n=1 Tax=Chroococcidiopsis sp. SAG 2025 TaxID=171389 RepID=UPI0029373EF4|nr:hypothetical protein [Chroococcidiopsis sp. SAG 2025]MDV2997434.1 hypothetical protein [Chroococcidiopsis sp. SAG 2025]